MAKGSIPVGLPRCVLLRELAKKTAVFRTAPSRTPAYLEWLKALRDRIAPELSYTNVTFPLFTPHDEQNHIHPLFVLAERLLGSDILQSLNATELFVLACSLYAHDWGMAVSEPEKKCLLGLVATSATDSFSLLGTDRSTFAKLLRDHRIGEARVLGDVPLELWQTHIRKTHAARSAHRVRAFFSAIDGNLGEAVALVSEGHNLDVERLRSFETALPLQGESANIRALALYLRLIDLFDLAQDRTPYALWNFISPEDPKSAEEWSRHRALSPVVIEQFQETSRCVKVRGATYDHRVYAALEDLREYCDSQLHVINGLLNELEPGYQPRLLHLDWKVEPKGFEPISVRFEFDRQAMIDVLSDEIYRGDRYVFLRELLQNSIDAIRLRRALHDSKNTGVTFDGAIHVKVEHQTEGRATVSWTDNGCGMSAFIVRNYLTVAGRSFYRSEDFQKLGVKMDPISRFGVGILSCFMVADQLEIVTRQDPQIESWAEALKIEVHNPKRHLRIQRYAPDALPSVGTTVKVFVGSLTSNDETNTVLAKLDVTGYLKDVAGFVEFPIYVEEDGRRTLILHPDCIASYGNTTGWEVVALDCSFAWQDFFVPQDTRRARDFFTEERITIKPNAKNPLFEGTISFPVLKEDIELRSHYSGTYDEDAHMAIRGTTELGTIRIRRRWSSEQKRSGKARSSDCDNMCRIYCDGVLVAGASALDWVGGSWGWDNPSTFRLVLNIRRTAETKLDLSRHDIAAGEHNWSEFVLQRCVDSFRKRAKQIVADGSPQEALYRLARLVSYGSGFCKSLSELIGDIAIPLVVLEKTGDVTVVRSTKLMASLVNVVPKSLAERLSKTIFADWASRKWLQGKAIRIPWSGGPCVFAEHLTYLLRTGEPESLSSVEQLHEDWLAASHDLTGVRLLSPGKKKEPPLVQEMWFPKKFHNRKSKECDQATVAVKTALKVNTDLAKLRHKFAYYAPKFVEFAAPFERFFTAGWQYLNVLHPAVKALAECIKAIAEKQSAGTVTDHDLGTICDVLRTLFGERSRGWSIKDYLSGSAIEEKSEEIRQLFDLTSKLEVFELSTDLPWATEPMNVPAVVGAGKLGAPILSLREVGL
jgi:hypothetical protein